MDDSTEAGYHEERIELRERIRNADSAAERREAVLRLAEIDRETHAETYARLARE